MWIIGVDGGGTKCEAGLFTSNGEILATALAGPANLYANFEGALDAIEQSAEQLLSMCQAQHNITITKQDCFLSLGCAGGSIDSVKRQFQQWHHEYAGAVLTTDVHVSCLAANNAKPCALFVIGTGSCLAVYSPEDDLPINYQQSTTQHQAKRTLKQYGGHGFLLGDIASGAWLGKLAVSWYLQALETPHQDSQLLSALANVLGDNTSQIIEQYGQAHAGDFGTLAPILIAVQDTSVTLNNWLQEGAVYAASLLINHSTSNVPIFLTGGLAAVYKPLIEKLIGRDVHIPNDTAIYGAYLAAKAYLAIQK
ncbi:MAG: glucosamine kinase [Alphaproteobacteria bacterium]|jgi:glucosamine kinase